MHAAKTIIPAVTAIVLLYAAAGAQSFRRAGTASLAAGGTVFNARRSVRIPPGKTYSVVVTEFFHHGEITPDGRNLAVAARNQKPVPSRVLQLGPGDFCRLAFQTLPRQDSYEIFYGGDPPTETLPPWTATDGLLLETRHYKHCDLQRLDSVRDAFNSSKPFGSDYVQKVHHSRNPFSLKPGPFLSCYSGYLHVPSAGKYGFLTSSRDCSFLLIGGKQVVSAPGRHGPAYRARRGSRKDVQLLAGRHKFEYYHAATGPSAVMAAFWEVNPTDLKPQKPVVIPTEAFRTGSVGHLLPGYVILRPNKLLPDFLVKISGDVPLPDNNLPLIGVRFIDASPKALTMKAKVLWDFGDGQTGDRLSADHVYLHPGVYAVKLSLKRGSKTLEIVNRVNVDRPLLTVKDKGKLHKLDDYLPILETYQPRTLDVVALRQLVLAYEAKALALQTQAEEDRKKAEAGDPNARSGAPKRPPAARMPAGGRGAAGSEGRCAVDAKYYIEKAVAAGKVAFLEESAARGDQELHKLAELIGPMAREQLGNSQLAFQIWQGAARRISDGPLQAECETEAADVAVNDLLSATAAKSLLDAATAHLETVKTGKAASKLQRVWGDYYAVTGDGKAARKAYNRAERILASRRSYIQRTARRGAHGRSAEEFIRQGQLDRAAAQIRLWQSEFPAERMDGYLTLMYAQYWDGRGLHAQAVKQADQLQAVNADSPYADRLLVLAADCHLKDGRFDRALATLHSLLNDYPGSPLVPEVKKKIAWLEARTTGGAKKPRAQSGP